ncbi:amphiregulin [Latimeria chalumnae]|uniref:amphiregulin n=1 Tax=Latimeria chalumnae TaxID=7897 RepID=UPI0003C10E02|nr:PREDICTED: amphiregulin [Latimeria chalumnae]|eukprot:XP_006009407.1 PREDICTED: amphiregulin [Latimeria chalumnae]
MNVLLLVLLLPTVYNWNVSGAALNESDTEAVLSFSGDHADTEDGIEDLELDAEGRNNEETENNNELSSSGNFSLEEGPRVQPVVKPKKTKGERKKGGSHNVKDKTKRKNDGKAKRRKKKDPCETTYKDLCVHGKCKYLENLKQSTCQCYAGYEGERCVIQSLKSVDPEESNDISSPIALVIVAVVLSVISLIATLIVTVNTQKKHSSPYEGSRDETEKLKKDDNGRGHIVV